MAHKWEDDDGDDDGYDDDNDDDDDDKGDKKEDDDGDDDDYDYFQASEGLAGVTTTGEGEEEVSGSEES